MSANKEAGTFSLMRTRVTATKTLRKDVEKIATIVKSNYISFPMDREPEQEDSSVDESSDEGSSGGGWRGGGGFAVSGLAGMLGLFQSDDAGSAAVLSSSSAAASSSSAAAAAAAGAQGKKRGRGEPAPSRAPVDKAAAGPAPKRSTHRGAGGGLCPVPSDASSVFVTGLPFAWREDSLLAAVFTSGLPGCAVAECRLALDGEGKGRGFGFVRFASEGMAGDAMAAQACGRPWVGGGRELRLEVCRKELLDKFHEPPKPPKVLPPVFGTATAFRPRAVAAKPKQGPAAAGGGGGGGGAAGAAGAAEAAEAAMAP